MNMCIESQVQRTFEKLKKENSDTVICKKIQHIWSNFYYQIAKEYAGKLSNSKTSWKKGNEQVHSKQSKLANLRLFWNHLNGKNERNHLYIAKITNTENSKKKVKMCSDYKNTAAQQLSGSAAQQLSSSAQR